MALAVGTTIERTYRVPVSTLRTWKSRGRLTDHGRDHRGRALYDPAEVAVLLGQVEGCAAVGCALPAVQGAPAPLCSGHLAACANWVPINMDPMETVGCS